MLQKTNTRTDIMMGAADLVERERHYRFMQTWIPESCDDVGCALGWAGYLMGDVFDLDEVATRLGFDGPLHFYEKMGHVLGHVRGELGEEGCWQRDPHLAAQCLRKLALEETEK